MQAWPDGGAHDAQRRARPWLGWAGAGGPPARRPATPAAESMLLRISVRGCGLASCTKARLRAADGAVCPARIVAAPAVSVLHPSRLAGTSSSREQASGPSVDVELCQNSSWRLWEVGMKIGRSLRDRVVGPQAEQTAADGDEPLEELVLEATLPPAMASSVGRELASQQREVHKGQGAGPLELQLRSDFFVRRLTVALAPCTAWILSDSAHGAEALMDGLCAPPGLACRTEGMPFSSALAGNVRYVSLWPDASRAAAALPVMADLAARHLQEAASEQHKMLLAEQHPGGNPGSQASTQASWHQRPNASDEDSARASQQAVILPVRASTSASQSLRRAASAAESVIGAQMSGKLAQFGAWVREGASGAVQGVQARLRLLQHGRLWRALQLQPQPQLLILCLRAAPGDGRRQHTGAFWRPFGSAETADAGVRMPGDREADSWDCMNSYSGKALESLRALGESARVSHIPVLVVLLSSGSGRSTSRKRVAPLPDGLEAASAGMLTLHCDGKKLASEMAWQLKTAVCQSLTGAIQQPNIISKL